MGSGYRVFTAGEVLSASNVQNYLQDQAVMVFGGTAARSSAIGTANFEEGMLTYLTDVDKLQVYTGAAFADVYPAAATNQGLTLINTTSFSGVASQSVSNVFNSTYQNYIFTWNVTCAATTELWLRLRTASDDSGNNYYGNRTTMQFSSSTVTGGNYNADSKINFGEGFAEQSAGFANIMNPNVSSRTLCLIQHYGNDRWNPSGFQTGVSTQYTGITILGGTQNITGSVSVYGYNK